MYRLLLLLLPRQRREIYGAEMADVFSTLCSEVRRKRGWLGVTGAWIKETMGMAKFAMREHRGRPGAAPHHLRTPRSLNPDEWRWAWRGIRTRGWRAVFIAMLFGVALGANAVVFSAADAFVFNTLPFDRPGQLVIFERSGFGGAPSDYTNRDPIFEWRKHSDLFAGIQAHDRGPSAYLTAEGITEAVRAQRIRPGLLELLGVLPSEGRPFVSADASVDAPPVVIISHTLARRLFGDAESALGRTFDTGTSSPTVVGVMPPQFRFPSAVEEIWQPMDLTSVPHNVGVRHVARLQPAQSLDAAARAVADRLSAVVAVLPEDSRRLYGRRVANNELRLRSLEDFRRHPDAATIFPVLVGAAGSLLLIACANVTSLEVAASATRMRTFAVQTALGASRASLIRIGFLEGFLLLAASTTVAWMLATMGSSVLAAQLSVEMRDAMANSLDPDARVVTFLLVVASMTWLLTSLPSVLRVSRLSLTSGLRSDPRTMLVSGGSARARQLLMTAQVSLTVVLLVGALLYIRTYEARIGLDKGLNADAVATLTVFQPPDVKRDQAELESEVTARLRALPEVRALSRTSLLPPSTQAGISGRLEILGREGEVGGEPMLSFHSVDPEYFGVMGITTVRGAAFSATTRPEEVVVDERFAQAFWPDGSALGARFRMGGAGIAGVSTFEIAGVSRQWRQDRVATPNGEGVYVGYIRLSPTSHPLTYVVKLDDARRLDHVASAVRAISPRLIVRTDTVEARYRRLEGDTRLTAAITGGLGPWRGLSPLAASSP